MKGSSRIGRRTAGPTCTGTTAGVKKAQILSRVERGHRSSTCAKGPGHRANPYYGTQVGGSGYDF